VDQTAIPKSIRWQEVGYGILAYNQEHFAKELRKAINIYSIAVSNPAVADRGSKSKECRSEDSSIKCIFKKVLDRGMTATTFANNIAPGQLLV
jgi:hypothetical protein